MRQCDTETDGVMSSQPRSAWGCQQLERKGQIPFQRKDSLPEASRGNADFEVLAPEVR